MSTEITEIRSPRSAEHAPGYRQAPHNLEAEQALLGSLLVNNDTLSKVQDFLRSEHFFDPAHQRIFDAIVRLCDNNQIADPIKLKPYFEHDDSLADVGGAAYLVRLAASAATIVNAWDYGRTIYDLALRRALVQIGEAVAIRAYDAPVDEEASEQITEAEKQLFDLAETGELDAGAQPFSRALKTAVDNIRDAYQDPDSLSGVTTGLTRLNEQIGGLHASDLVILAGRPAMGKTALATNIAYAAARRYHEDQTKGEDLTRSKGAVVGFFSLEMSADQLAARILSDIANRHYDGPDTIQSHAMRQGKLNDDKFMAIVRAANELEDLPLLIDDTPALSVTALRTRARRLKRQHNLGLVVVDYLQLLRGSGRGTANESRVQEISEITRNLKGLAKELNVPVLALSQLSRQVEQRENKRPLLSDLRESGSIEQDADMVMFVFREEYYKEKEQPGAEDVEKHSKWQSDMTALFGKAELIIGKQRHGPVGTVNLHFDKEVTRFSDWVDQDRLPEQM